MRPNRIILLIGAGVLVWGVYQAWGAYRLNHNPWRFVIGDGLCAGIPRLLGGDAGGSAEEIDHGGTESRRRHGEVKAKARNAPCFLRVSVPPCPFRCRRGQTRLAATEKAAA